MPNPQQLLSKKQTGKNRIGSSQIGLKPNNFVPSKAMLADEPISEMETIKTMSLNNAFGSN